MNEYAKKEICCFEYRMSRNMTLQLAYAFDTGE